MRILYRGRDIERLTRSELCDCVKLLLKRLRDEKNTNNISDITNGVC